MGVRMWRVGVALLVVALFGCTPWTAQPDASAAASEPVAASAPANAHGYWEAHAGDIGISEWAVGEIYNYDWYAIDMATSTRAEVVWDNGINCGRTPATLVGNVLRLTAGTVSTAFVIHDARTATVTFRQGARTWVKQLEKTRADPTVMCM